MTPPPRNSLQGPSILVLDDEQANLQVVRMVLMREKLHCQLHMFDQVDTAMAFLKDHRVDLILSDVVMPRKNGFDLLNELKADPALREIPVIMLSAIQEADYVSRGLEAGAADYIGKPIIPKVLSARIRATLRLQQLKEELVRRNEELEKINQMKDEFLSICSHDLRSPLTAIDLVCQFLRESIEGKASHPPEILVNRIINQASLARRLVENLLNLDKINEGQLNPSPSFVSLPELLAECLEAEMPMIQGRKLEYQAHWPQEEALAYFDRNLAGQMIRNLMGNAVKFAESKIMIEAAWEGLDQPCGGRLVLDISNDGEPISPSLREELFKKHTQSGNPASGTGLGLYIAQKIAHTHHGFVELAEKPGYSTTFRIDCPLIFHPSALPDLSAHAVSKLLIISSGDADGKQMENLFQEAGLLNVETHQPEEEQTDLVLAGKPHIGLVDLNSHPRGLFTLVKRINQNDSSTQWIFYGQQEELEELKVWIKAPFTPVTPPLNPLIMLNLVKRLLEEPPAALPQG